MKKPYIKKITTVSKFNVFFVDGKYVRDRLSEEFTNFGQHFGFRFIPKNEFWIDRARTPGEEKFFVDHMLVENRLMAEGMGYDDALARADRAEMKERRKTEYLKKGIRPRRKKSEYILKIHKKLLKRYSTSKIQVWIVDGEMVRDLYFIDFTEGGHDKVYKFVPPGEVWLDDDLQLKEIKYVLIHEVHERRLMAQGWPYFKAHRSASHIEYHCRHHPAELDKTLQKEIDKNR
ncbi:MAG: hypothetical protein NTU60_07435 [Candidatus Aminicenantes bacterium]|nr:hypothetical protein [Candidatus Aminicenantes bacterium]